MLRVEIDDAKIEELFDRMLVEPYVVLDDAQLCRRLGRVGRPLRGKLLHISTDELTGEKIAILKYNNTRRKRHPIKKKKRGDSAYYLFPFL